MKRHVVGWLSIVFVGVMLIWGCRKPSGVDPSDECEPLTHIDYEPTPKEVVVPPNFPPMPVPPDNPITEEGVALGRYLFYDPILSSDSTMSCASCHMPELSFTDGLAVSEGVTGEQGTRSAMSLLNVGYFLNGLFWDGRSPDLEDQALQPVENPVELHESWPRVEEKLRRHSLYPELFRKAFGIENTCEITKELTAKAIAQFERILVSSGQSKYDRRVNGVPGVFFTESELRGFDMFFDISPELPDAECGHCHNVPFFTTNDYFNNGIEAVSDLNGFPDKGRGDVTGSIFDNGKFRAPTLRNITLTAPYMHDGRFQTLEEVLDHYNSGGHYADNRDPLIRPLSLTEEQKQDIINFLKTLEDIPFTQNPEFQNPWE